MKVLNPKVDLYLTDGCGRCELGGTPQCSVNRWPAELQRLREIVLSCGLVEDLKWGVPCYTIDNRNVVIVSALKESCALSFFKGVLLKDAKQILIKPGENSQSARLIRFTSVQEIVQLESVLKEYVLEAMELERSGAKVDFSAKLELVIPEELERKFEQLPALRTAFQALTPGRQRGYILHFTAAKQSKTREARIDKCTPQILEGRGMHD